MSDAALTELSAREIARRVNARELSPVAVVEAHLAAIARRNPAINAVVTLDAEGALAAARDLERRLAEGRAGGALAGVPVGVKDIHLTRGLRTTFGAPLMRDHVPDSDSLIVARCRAAGAIVIGKTNISEFALGSNSVNPVFGATGNPYDPTLSASGSTGGGAAGLAARMFALATGSDLGGSLRTPASFCGVAGLRPSPGLVPHVPAAQPFQSLGVDGPMARDCGDLALMLQAIAGPHPDEPHVVPVEGRDFVAAATGGPAPGLRVGYVPDIAGIGIDPDIERVCRVAAFALAGDGCVVEEAALDLSPGRDAFIRLRGQYVLAGHLDKLDKLERVGPNLAGNIRLGLAQGPADVARGELGRAEVLRRVNAFFARHDRLLTPCAPVPPFPHAQLYPETIAGKKMATYIDWVAPTFVLSLAGLPALSVPAGLDRRGLPVGIQVVAPRWNEEGALALGAAIEARTALPPPPLA
jgi:amidase